MTADPKPKKTVVPIKANLPAVASVPVSFYDRDYAEFDDLAKLADGLDKIGDEMLKLQNEIEEALDRGARLHTDIVRAGPVGACRLRAHFVREQRVHDEVDSAVLARVEADRAQDALAPEADRLGDALRREVEPVGAEL